MYRDKEVQSKKTVVKEYIELMNQYRSAILNTDEIKDFLKSGVTALKSNSRYVKVVDSRLIDGSVDIDNAVRNLYPNDSRWDYTIGYRQRAYFIEVHPMQTSSVKDIIKKKQWLVSWLNDHAPLLKEIRGDKFYYWLATNGNSILRGSRQSKQLAQNNIKTLRVFNLDNLKL